MNTTQKFATSEAKLLYNNLLNFFFYASDPSYQRLRNFRNQILKVKHPADRIKLVAIFEKEANQKIEYFEPPY